MGTCDVYWGSHGCMHARGHEGACACDCCDCPDGHHDSIIAPEEIGYPGVVCVAKPPYYGPSTTFYGDDVRSRGLPPLAYP
jgi:hypothetical protein